MDVLRENQEMCLPIFSFSHYFDNSTNVPVHTHPATELIYQAGGQCTVTIGKEKFLCTPGDLLVIPPRNRAQPDIRGPGQNRFRDRRHRRPAAQQPHKADPFRQRSVDAQAYEYDSGDVARSTV